MEAVRFPTALQKCSNSDISFTTVISQTGLIWLNGAQCMLVQDGLLNAINRYLFKCYKDPTSVH